MAMQSPQDIVSRDAEAVVIIKAAPQAGKVHGEVVCCAGMDRDGKWLRLYPVSFKRLEQGQRFKRWDLIRFSWRPPKGDNRQESRRVNQHTIEIIGELSAREHHNFISKAIVTSLKKEHQEGRSLALLRADIEDFRIAKRPESELAKEKARFEMIRAAADNDMFSKTQVIPHTPCPYDFKYRYRSDDGISEGTCQDWETEATYFRWTARYGEQKALDLMQQTFGHDIPKRGMLLAMGTHRRWRERWLINGIIQVKEPAQMNML